MTYQAELKKRILDVFFNYAPTRTVLKMNQRATAEWQECARRDPRGIEAYGLRDILALRRKLLHLYWKNMLARFKAGVRLGSAPDAQRPDERALGCKPY